MEVDNDFLMRMDSEAMLICMPEKYGGMDKKLSDITFLEFRKFLYKKYYKEEVDFKPCGEEFEFMEGDNIYKAMCGGEDGLCDSCTAKEKKQ